MFVTNQCTLYTPERRSFRQFYEPRHTAGKAEGGPVLEDGYQQEPVSTADSATPTAVVLWANSLSWQVHGIAA